MAIRVALQHRTSYRFDRPVKLSPHEIRLRPAPHCRTPVLGYSLTVAPANHFLNWQQDPYGNWVARLVFPERATSLDITVDVVADLTVVNPFDFFIEEYAEHYPFAYAPGARQGIDPVPRSRAAGPSARRVARILPHDDAPGRAHGRHAGAAQPAAAARDQVPRPDGARGADARGNIRQRAGLLPRQRVAAGADPAESRFGRPLRVGLPDPARRRRQIARRPIGHRQGFHRPARLGRSLSSGCRVDRARSDLGPARGRRTSSARMHGGPGQCGARRGLHRSLPGRLLVRDERHARARGSARDETVYGRAMGGDRRARASCRRRPRRARRPPDAGRRADLRLDRRHGRRGVEHRRAGSKEARAGGGPAAPSRQALRARRLPAHGTGQVVSGGAAAALGAGRLLARRWHAALAGSGIDRRYPREGQGGHRRRAAARDRACGRARNRRGARDHRVRGRAEAARRRSGAAGKCRSAAGRSFEADGTRASRAAPAAGSRPAGGFRPAIEGHCARRPERNGMDEQPMAAATRAPLCRRRRFAAGLALAAFVAARRAAGGRGRGASGRPLCAQG